MDVFALSLFLITEVAQSCDGACCGGRVGWDGCCFFRDLIVEVSYNWEWGLLSLGYQRAFLLVTLLSPVLPQCPHTWYDSGHALCPPDLFLVQCLVTGYFFHARQNLLQFRF